MRWISLCRIDPPALAAMCLTLGSLAGTFASQGPATPAAQSSARGADQALRLRLALDRYHAQYDPVERMLRTPFSSPGYHTRLKGGTVHPTRTSLEYAVALLDTGDDEFKERAVAILRRVIALQDKDPASKTYGIWSWFLEEPLDQMSPPDWNWADFCGTQLLQVARDHREKLPADLREALDAAIRHAARSVQRRNVGPGYTNIAIMGTYVTLATAEMFDIADLRKYAIERLRRFHEYTLRQGAFTEYNSPTYTVVALKELGRMRLHIRDAEARRLVEELYRVAWEEIAWHFHAPTRQWAGPHSRSYSTLLGRGVLALIQRSTEGRVALGAEDLALDEVRPAVPCPRDLEPCFRELTVPRPLVKTFLKGDPPLVGTTHLDPDFALGSVNRGDLWNQRRPLLAYWGTAAAPGSFRVRCLHDGYDFAAAQFFSAQQGGDVLAAVVFATDGGDTHVSLDRLTNATFHARDLRLRFEFGGAAAATKVPVPAALSDTVRLRFDRVRLQLAVHRAVFGQEHCRWEAGGDKEASTLDLVLYQGPGRSVNLAELQAAAVGFALRIDTGGVKLPSVLPGSKEGWMAMRWGSLALAVPSRPDRVAVLQRSAVFQ